MKDLTYFLERLRDLRWLAGPELEGKCVMDSSLNQRMGPRDCNFFLRDEGEGDQAWHVLVDYDGPGCLTRFWTAGDFDGELEFFFDGAGEPAIRTTLCEFFSGRLHPFVKPVVMDCADSSQGRVSYLPIPFARSCKVRARSDTGSFYWQINALRYGPEVAVRTLQARLNPAEQRALEAVCARWGEDHGFPADAGAELARVEIPRRSEVVLLEAEGEGCLDGLDFDLGGEPEALSSLALQIFWDGDPEPALAAPLSHFFCQGSKPRDFSSLLLQRRGGRLSAAFPMPYGWGARVKLVNSSTADLALGAGIRRSAAPCNTDLRFHCRYRREHFTYGTLYQALKLVGRGRFVGLNQVTQQVGGSVHGCFNQEGNEYIYTDGEQDPSWLGTGTEDYFNCAYFYLLGEVDTPTHGCLDQRYSDTGAEQQGRVSAYRLHLLDSVPFHKSLVLLQEAGCPKKGALAGINGKEQLVYQWTCYWYQGAVDLS
jgi:hypothetical protein